MTKKYVTKALFHSFLFLSIPLFTYASYEYTPLQNVIIPGNKNLYNKDILVYLANLYTFAIAIAGGLAVVRIVYAGIKYMTSDAFGLKSEAKNQIQAALIGLLMALCSYVFLYTINPKLVKLTLKIAATDSIVGNGRDLFTTGTVSGGRPPTPGVNNPPNRQGAEIVPALPERGDSDNPNDDTGSVLPPKPTGEATSEEDTQRYYELGDGIIIESTQYDSTDSLPISDTPQTPFTVDQIPKL
jgi:hypothetical protein